MIFSIQMNSTTREGQIYTASVGSSSTKICASYFMPASPVCLEKANVVLVVSVPVLFPVDASLNLFAISTTLPPP